MFIKKLAGIGVLCMGISGGAQAATYEITDILSYSANGFGSSLFHEGTGCDGMCGSTVATVTAGTASGTWNSVTGALSMDFDTSLGSVSASGTIENSTTRTGGVFGSLTFSGAITSTLSFLDRFYGTEPNGLANSLISLWGSAAAEDDIATNGYDSGFATGGLGGDFRIQLSSTPIDPDPDTTPVPLPASLALMLAGLGALTGLRRRG